MQISWQSLFYRVLYTCTIPCDKLEHMLDLRIVTYRLYSYVLHCITGSLRFELGPLLLPKTTTIICECRVHRLIITQPTFSMKPNELRDWEWMVCKPQSKSQLACPGLAALQPHNTFDVEILYHVAHFDVITRLNPTAMLPFPHLPRENTSEFIDLS